ncbi:glycosyltransferase family 2 protein [Aeromicrobium sp. Marseille-Q0843]|uniref:Glycosyltransferase family 2 protein n=1 Tax=Aeromicrobium phoceense TaxID=2754045 RepID=A0A838XE01_9ACTN|nr:glycosyltransferase family 2 protein [Aeromicrobium phoceense]
MSAADLAIVIVTYNSADWVGRCLDSLPAALGDLSAELVVVDNASVDDSAEVVQRHAPHARLLRNDANVGFARAVNQGAAASSAPWVLMLNPDMDARPGSLAELVDFARRHPGHGMYGGRTLTTEGDLEPSSCWGLPSLWSTFCFASGLSTVFRHSTVFDPESLGRWPRDTVREVGMITGCLLLVERDLWNRLGGFDERYFVYGEDADLSARARSLGARPVIDPAVEVVHAVGRSSEGTAGSKPLLLAGKITYARTHHGRGAPLGVALLRAGVGLRALGSRLTGRGAKWLATWRRRGEWWDGFPGEAR